MSRLVIAFLYVSAALPPSAALAQQGGGAGMGPPAPAKPVQSSAPPAPAPRADALIGNARDAYAIPKPTPGCADDAAAASGDIVVCGGDNQDGRLPEDLRRLIAEEQKRTADGLPRAPDPSQAPGGIVQSGMMNVTRLPQKWKAMGSDYGRPPDTDPAMEQMKRAMAAVAAQEAAAQAAAEGSASTPAGDAGSDPAAAVPQ